MLSAIDLTGLLYRGRPKSECSMYGEKLEVLRSQYSYSKQSYFLSGKAKAKPHDGIYERPLCSFLLSSPTPILEIMTINQTSSQRTPRIIVHIPRPHQTKQTEKPKQKTNTPQSHSPQYNTHSSDLPCPTSSHSLPPQLDQAQNS